MKLSKELSEFCDRIGHRFTTPDLWIQAITHASMSSGVRSDNQRLEFVGDRVLNLVVAEALFQDDPTASEGTLAPRYNAMVRKETCAEIARTIDLGAVLKLGRSEMQSGGRRKDALLADALEAVIAAIYFDAGLEPARAFVLTHWGDRVKSAEAHVSNAKSELQEWAQALGMPTPVYSEVSRDGPPHAPQFVIQATLSDGRAAQAKAGSKRAAEQAAAATLLQKVNADD